MFIAFVLFDWNKIGQGIIQFGFLNLVEIPFLEISRKDDYSSF